MIRSFELSQECLWSQNFCVIYDETTKDIKESKGGKESRISYFSDFIFMQQLMTLEIDITFQHHHDNIKHLAGPNRNSEAWSRKDSKPDSAHHNNTYKFVNLDFDIELKKIEFSSNKTKIACLEEQIKVYSEIFGEKYKMEDNDVTIQEQNKGHLEKTERFGLKLFKRDHLLQYTMYLKGLHNELEMGDFYLAKKEYINSLTKTIYVNHRIRKLALERLISINHKIGFSKESPEKVLISRYYIKQKYV